MDATVWWVLALVVALIAGPFAALRAVSHLRMRRPPRPPPKDEDESDPDKPTGFW